MPRGREDMKPRNPIYRGDYMLDPHDEPEEDLETETDFDDAEPNPYPED